MAADEADTLRVVLLGKTGAGKSSTGNTLLGREAFRVGRGLRSGTEKCQWADAETDGCVLQVTDTPGVSDTHRPEEEVLREVGKSIAVASPGPHVILMVIRCDRPFTSEELLAYITLKEIFGPNVIDYMIVVFVGTDSFDDTLEEQSTALQKTVNATSGSLQTVLGEVKGRYFGMNNKASASDRQRLAGELIKLMKRLRAQQGGACFQNSVSDTVTALVRPLVEQRQSEGGVSREEAVRQTNQAILAESVPEKFLTDLFVLMNDRVLPLFKQGVQVAKEAYAIYVTVRACAVM